jgi:hypothetical protein
MFAATAKYPWRATTWLLWVVIRRKESDLRWHFVGSKLCRRLNGFKVLRSSFSCAWRYFFTIVNSYNTSNGTTRLDTQSQWALHITKSLPLGQY